MFAKKLDHLNKSRVELLWKFAIELQQIHLINIAKYDVASQTQIGSAIPMCNITLVTDIQICYEVPAGAIVFSSPYEYFNFSFQIVRVYEQPPNDDVDTFYRWCWNIDPMSIALPGRVMGELIDTFMFYGLMSYRMIFGVNIADILQILPIINGTERCSKMTQAICKYDCALHAVAQQCGCIPFGETFYDDIGGFSNMG